MARHSRLTSPELMIRDFALAFAAVCCEPSRLREPARRSHEEQAAYHARSRSIDLHLATNRGCKAAADLCLGKFWS